MIMVTTNKLLVTETGYCPIPSPPSPLLARQLSQIVSTMSRAHVLTYWCSTIDAYLAAKQPRHEVRVGIWLDEIRKLRRQGAAGPLSTDSCDLSSLGLVACVSNVTHHISDTVQILQLGQPWISAKFHIRYMS